MAGIVEVEPAFEKNAARLPLTLRRRWHEAAGQGRPLALLLVDVDHFKRYNDRYGHPAGDECLRRVAQAMAGAVRQGDMLARIGGEEFGLLLAECPAEGPAHTAERLRAAVQTLGLPHADSDTCGVVTVSIGFAIAWPQDSTGAPALVDSADEALYEAKRSGRNRWVAAAEPAAA